MISERFGSLPNVIKIITPVVTLLCMLSLGLAHYQPAGTEFIWFVALFSLIFELIIVAFFALEIEDLIVPKKLCTWPLVECFLSLLFSILFFICMWLCVNGSEYGSTTAFSIAGFFCMTNFILYAFDFALFLRIHISLTRLYETSVHEAALNRTSYGAP
uniref:MARVEL domain-containing protein n=2 Tax=Steinernema glaseri TaxID=37863 RepID=A0A1I8ALC3_9BILA